MSDFTTHVKISDPIFYRRVGLNRDVLDTAGSLSDGGRFNIGGAQASSIVTRKFGTYGQKRSALYLGEDALIVRKEYGDYDMPISKAITYKVTFIKKTSIYLIDFTLVLNDLKTKIPDIFETIGTQSMNGKWGDLKKPTPTQILGQWLIDEAKKIENKSLGIIFPSTHDKNKSNVCLYFNDTKECKKILNASPEKNKAFSP